MENPNKNIRLRRVVSIGGFITLILLLVVFGSISYVMNGPINMINTFINTAYDLLITTVFKIMAITVIVGALGAFLSEFGVVAILNKMLSYVMKPIYNLPGAAALGVVTTFLSDNPAILTLAKEKDFRKYFKKYQLPALTNLGTAYGMGLIVITVMISLSSMANQNFFLPAMVGLVGAIIGSIISVRLMLHYSKKLYGDEELNIVDDSQYDFLQYREIRQGTFLQRALDSILEGGKSGVEMGMAIIPGVLIICSIVMILTNGPGPNGYTGTAYEGVELLPLIAERFQFIIQPLFGFSSPEAIAFPITSIGAVGAALTLLPDFIENNLIGARDIAVFTAIGMCWSGYLSTHVAMMDQLDSRELTGKAILSHTIGGVVAGIAANLIYSLVTMLF
ncbi:MAG: putative rane protein [Haloplasmataceae bacterium]|nr:putative rane protein [Haloplasmataceae bacterium]